MDILSGHADVLERTCRLAERSRVTAQEEVRATRGRLCSEAAAISSASRLPIASTRTTACTHPSLHMCIPEAFERLK